MNSTHLRSLLGCVTAVVVCTLVACAGGAGDDPQSPKQQTPPQQPVMQESVPTIKVKAKPEHQASDLPQATGKPQARQSTSKPGGSSESEQIGIQWQVGDTWTVETETVQIQRRNERESKARVRWTFEVKSKMSLEGRPTFKLFIRCQADGRQPEIVALVDAQSYALRQLEMELPTANGFQKLVEHYEVGNNTASPVLTPLSALPLDFPVFQQSQQKPQQSYQYKAVSGYPGKKAVDDIAFIYSVTQKSSTAEPAVVKSLLGESYQKNLGGGADPIDVRIQSVDREVRQLWHPGLPWPSWSNNGTTETRLVDFHRGEHPE